MKLLKKITLSAILIVALGFFTAASLASCGQKAGSEAETEEAETEEAEHPEGEHPSDSAEHPSDSTEHPADSTSAQ
ncbi:MAG: hypothetical protein AB7K37_11065 [Cyclobacteriaceae bacterium]